MKGTMKKVIGTVAFMSLALAVSPKVIYAEDVIVTDVVQDENFNQSLSNIINGFGSVNDFQTIGITCVNEQNILEINCYILNHEIDTYDAIVDGVNAFMDAWNAVNDGTATSDDFDAIGMIDYDETFSVQINEAIRVQKEAMGRNLDCSEINWAIQETLTNINNAISRINNGGSLLEDYQLLMLTSVTEDNWCTINTYMWNHDNSTYELICANIEKYFSAIEAFNNGTESASDYEALDITDYNETYAPIVNHQIAAAKEQYGCDLTCDDIQWLVQKTLQDIESAIERINNGGSTLEDYQLLMLTSVTEDNWCRVNSYMWNHDNSTYELICANLEKYFSAVEAFNNGTASAADYKALDITDYNETYVAIINQQILETKELYGYDLSCDDISWLVQQALQDIESAIERINNGGNTLEDYQLLMLDSVTEDNWCYVNTYMWNHDNSTYELICANLEKYFSAVEAFNNGTETASDYETLDITDYNESYAAIINQQILETKEQFACDLTSDDIQYVVQQTITKIEQTIANINSGCPSYEDYQFLMFTSVTSDNLPLVNEYMSSLDNSTYELIVANLDSYFNQ